MSEGPEAARLELVIARREKVANNVVLVDLACPDGSALPPWTAGAHVALHLRPGLDRQYSLCGDPSDRSRWQVAVLLEPSGRGGSKFVHDSLRENTRVLASAPLNHFPLVRADRYLFIAGGIGITPIKVMMAAAEDARIPFAAVYGGRSRHSMAFLKTLCARHGDRIDVRPQDERGLLDLDEILSRREDGTLVYCCGPEGLIKAVEARSSGWPPGTLHVERFKPKDVAEAESRGFEVELAKSGMTLVVPPTGSILEVVEAAGVEVACSCREGTCGMCKTRVIAGTIEHRDSWLTDQEQASGAAMMICVSRAAGSGLVLDL
jgi:ferredoxin-NADP reductase